MRVRDRFPYRPARSMTAGQWPFVGAFKPYIAALTAALLLFASDAGSLLAADVTARDVAIATANAKPGETLDYTDADLSLIDLAGLNLAGAKMIGADLYGTDLTGTKLSGADLTDVRLDRATVIRTDFSKAILNGATLALVSTFEDAASARADVANFAGAQLKGARILARLAGAVFREADLSDADLSELKPGTGTIASVPKTYLSGADFSHAKLIGADLTGAIMDFAIFRNADLSGAVLRGADLRGADLTGANLSGADLTGARLDGARLDAASGVDGIKQDGTAN